MVIDNQLKFNAHIKNLFKKASFKLHMLLAEFESF